MRINTNVDAMRAYSNYATWNAAKSKSLLRISSGKRINSFADDPAGACIAVKMGVQVSGLKGCQKKCARRNFADSDGRRCFKRNAQYFGKNARFGSSSR